MKALIAYIKDVLGFEIEIQPLAKAMKDKLPIYLNVGYDWHKAMLADRPCILAQMKEANSFSIAQMEKHFEHVTTTFGIPIIAVFNKIEAYNRKRLIEKKIAFIVPNKQLYIPDFIIDIREYSLTPQVNQSKLTSVAQQLILLNFLKANNDLMLESKTFQELAVLLGSNSMGITLPDKLKEFGIKIGETVKTEAIDSKSFKVILLILVVMLSG